MALTVSGSSFKIYCKANPNFNLAVKGQAVLLVPADPSDESQMWYEDETFSNHQDQWGFPSFALVNKATGLVMKHSIKDPYPVQLVPYNPFVYDESVQWTNGADLGGGYKAIRMINNTSLNLDASHGDDAGIHDGTPIIVHAWHSGTNQQWIIAQN